MNVLAETSGTLVNALTVLVGSALGVLLGGRLSAQTQRTLLQTLSLVTLYIALNMAGDLGKVEVLSVPGVILALISLAVGGVLGEALRLEARLEQAGEALKRRFRGGGRFTEGFVAASLLFCVGPLTLIGSIQNGLALDPSSLLVKATLDGVASLALAGVYGVGVGFSVIVVLLLQGGLSLGAAALAAAALPGGDPGVLAESPYVLLITGTGGLMIAGIAWNLMLAGLGFERERVRVAALLPALAVAPCALWLLGRL